MEQLPRSFCWTKMGAESGEQLQLIIRRKEWERSLGNGLFFWGIGQSLGGNADLAMRGGEALKVLFSPMISKAKAIDSTPDETVVWTAYVDTYGEEHPLPEHALVTSRATLPSGRRKESHYALVCRSPISLATTGQLSVDPNSICNFATNKPLGASQVTAIVRNNRDRQATAGKVYPVSFSAELVQPCFIRLSSPRLLSSAEKAMLARAVENGAERTWRDVVTSIRRIATKPRARTPKNFDLFETLC
ncbi:hypothetical protein E2553_24630 [Paraburkholderia dipogonis]|uniref:Uncharacterized protein n=1 Tax=Paraburkholderia dipogonis TaxID=1211383 RepID=A0A4Y8MRA5_9BURK|nr:hypothetical protein [Paraburkholderia dipogonis]TFE39981.1 hypothetical protein E2553_24630 [Paraburkholderia dipogonis]